MGLITSITTPPAPIPMGLGAIGTGNLIFKRQFRWTMEIQYCINGSNYITVAEQLVKVGARPQLDIEETQIDYLHGRMWIPGKVTWQTMTVTYYDVAGAVGLLLYMILQIQLICIWVVVLLIIKDRL